MNGVFTVLNPLFILIILDSFLERLDHSEVQFLTAVSAGLAGASRQPGESPKQLLRRDVWLSPPFVLRNSFQSGKVSAWGRADDPRWWS